MSRGSSPLTRGKPVLAVLADRQERLIPAHAGKTAHAPVRAHTGRAHPRSRGENSATPTVKGEFKGSSPLTRGKHRRRRPDSAACRLIPAHAGKTQEVLL